MQMQNTHIFDIFEYLPKELMRVGGGRKRSRHSVVIYSFA